MLEYEWYDGELADAKKVLALLNIPLTEGDDAPTGGKLDGFDLIGIVVLDIGTSSTMLRLGGYNEDADEVERAEAEPRQAGKREFGACVNYHVGVDESLRFIEKMTEAERAVLRLRVYGE